MEHGCEVKSSAVADNGNSRLNSMSRPKSFLCKMQDAQLSPTVKIRKMGSLPYFRDNAIADM
jgi:hypothetical protein